MADASHTKPTLQGKPSLASPEFSGLYDVVWIGRENDLVSRLRGMLAQTVFIGAWVFSGIFPMVFALLIYCRCHLTTLALLTAISYTFIFPTQPNYWAVRTFILNGSFWYTGGASLSFEMPPEGWELRHSEDPAKHHPTLTTQHPHGSALLSLTHSLTQWLSYSLSFFLCVFPSICHRCLHSRVYTAVDTFSLTLRLSFISVCLWFQTVQF